MKTPEIAEESRALEELTRSLEQHGVGQARVALVLGSGLGIFADSLKDARVVPYEELEEMPASRVPGHAGKLVLGEIGGVPVVIQQGRVHLYEGWQPSEVTRCVRAFGLLGVKTLLLTNAAGGLEAEWKIPALMRITDHLNLQSRTPLTPDERGVGCPYDPELGAILDRTAEELDLEFHQGIYAGLLGPTYETPAEIGMLRWAGAQAVGMSTVAEAAVAHAVGMKVAAISTITNHAAGTTGEALSHEEVVEAGRQVADRFCALLGAAVPRLG